MKKILSLFLCAVLFISGCSTPTDNNSVTTQETASVSETTEKEEADVAEETPTEEITEDAAKESVKGMYVEGRRLYDIGGNEIVLRGINHAHTWFKSSSETAIPAIAETGVNSIRIVLANGYQWEKDSLEDINRLLEICKELGLVVVLEVHDGTGKDDASVLEGIVDYWIEMKEALIGNENFVILNIANEWYGQWGDRPWADAYINAIPRLREAGIKNVIMVDAAGWGQYGESIAKLGKEVFDSDPMKNTMFSIHMYGSAGGSKGKIKRNIDDVINQDLCLVIGEFGYNHSDGDVKEDFIMEYCTEMSVGYMGWSWKGNGGGVEYLDIAKDWEGKELSSDWGEILINGKNGIRETSKMCQITE